MAAGPVAMEEKACCLFAGWKDELELHEGAVVVLRIVVLLEVVEHSRDRNDAHA